MLQTYSSNQVQNSVDMSDVRRSGDSSLVHSHCFRTYRFSDTEVVIFLQLPILPKQLNHEHVYRHMTIGRQPASIMTFQAGNCTITPPSESLLTAMFFWMGFCVRKLLLEDTGTCACRNLQHSCHARRSSLSSSSACDLTV